MDFFNTQIFNVKFYRKNLIYNQYKLSVKIVKIFGFVKKSVNVKIMLKFWICQIFSVVYAHAHTRARTQANARRPC